jgi:hypothetical protein
MPIWIDLLFLARAEGSWFYVLSIIENSLFYPASILILHF